jgi:LmbE family N-acetylglucosaminyl deacetylase
VLHATGGEAGEIAPGVADDAGWFGSARRRQEDENAWRALGRLPDRHDWLGYADGDLAAVGAETLCDVVAAFLRAEHPDVVVTFGPEDVTGYPNHIAVAQAGRRSRRPACHVEGLGRRRFVSFADRLPQGLGESAGVLPVVRGGHSKHDEPRAANRCS